MIFLPMLINKPISLFSSFSTLPMKTWTKLFLLIGITVMFFSYSSAQQFQMWWNTHIPTIQKNPPKNKKAIQKSGDKLPCELELWFTTKVNSIKDMCTKNVNMLNKTNTSLNGIIPLVKDTTIKNDLQVQQKNIQILIKNYTDLKTRLDQDPRNSCGQWPNPSWKTYAEQTKVLVKQIQTQFDLLKPKKK